MPINPKKGEEQQEFISRCIAIEKRAHPEMKSDQIAAICYNAWRKAHPGSAPPPTKSSEEQEYKLATAENDE